MLSTGRTVRSAMSLFPVLNPPSLGFGTAPFQLDSRTSDLESKDNQSELAQDFPARSVRPSDSCGYTYLQHGNSIASRKRGWIGWLSARGDEILQWMYIASRGKTKVTRLPVPARHLATRRLSATPEIYFEELAFQGQ
ncbi:hypothetical protein M7I_7527 [Glarea lozoyensis 74030]|uniref:Uncharacterized protein n=1 Tax=Glarea lozoyensis (strain ATCC 74030 / MF5533) TaxID=1104152 RepID=H0EXJ1_GLAL7|nr:hypothetical protein M7I_7527 [Glarea lozoyensis 74030]